MDVCARFKEDLGSQVVEDFNRLQQKGTVDEYLEQFEELKALMVQRTPTLPDSFFVDSFVGGLKPQLKPFVKALTPVTLADAMNLARLQKEAIEAGKAPNRLQANKPPLLPTPKSAPSPYTLTQSHHNTRHTPTAVPSINSSNSVTKPYNQSF